MKRLGILVNCREYFKSYIRWLISQDNTLFRISGFIDNGDLYSKTVDGYRDKRFGHTLEELTLQSDLVLSLGYWKIISKQIIESVPLGILNIHHSYMLRYRGRHMMTWAILNNEKTHGTTLHYMSEVLDDGPILDSREVKIEDDDTAYTLFMKVNDVGLQMLQDSLPIALDKEKLSSIQLKVPDKKYFEHRRKDMVNEVPLSTLEDPNRLLTYVRALSFPDAPKPYICVNNKKIFLSL